MGSGQKSALPFTRGCYWFYCCPRHKEWPIFAAVLLRNGDLRNRLGRNLYEPCEHQRQMPTVLSAIPGGIFSNSPLRRLEALPLAPRLRQFAEVPCLAVLWSGWQTSPRGRPRSRYPSLIFPHACMRLCGATGRLSHLSGWRVLLGPSVQTSSGWGVPWGWAILRASLAISRHDPT